MHDEEQIALLKHQIHEMDQDIENYLEQIEEQREKIDQLVKELEQEKKLKRYFRDKRN